MQQVITGQVTVAAVGVAKPVEVEEGDGERSPESGRLLKVGVERVFQGTSVGQPGEWIKGGEGPQPVALVDGVDCRTDGGFDRPRNSRRPAVSSGGGGGRFGIGERGAFLEAAGEMPEERIVGRGQAGGRSVGG